METDIQSFVSAGFTVTRWIPRPDYFSHALLPERIVSLSLCISPFIPDTWAIDWVTQTEEERLLCAQKFGLNEEQMIEAVLWISDQFGKEYAWPNICRHLSGAEILREKFLGDLDDAVVLELALHRDHLERFCEVAEPPPAEPGYSPFGRAGVLEILLEGRSVTSGKVLGFEPMAFDISLEHSWLCNGQETEIAEKLGICPNWYGMIERFDEACRCAEYIGAQGSGAEPGLWLPWLIIEH